MGISKEPVGTVYTLEYIQYKTCTCIYKGSKNISTKMLKDVGITVPKSRETSIVYIYAATQGMRGLYAARQRMKAVYYMHQDRG